MFEEKILEYQTTLGTNIRVMDDFCGVEWGKGE